MKSEPGSNVERLMAVHNLRNEERNWQRLLKAVADQARLNQVVEKLQEGAGLNDVFIENLFRKLRETFSDYESLLAARVQGSQNSSAEILRLQNLYQLDPPDTAIYGKAMEIIGELARYLGIEDESQVQKRAA